MTNHLMLCCLNSIHFAMKILYRISYLLEVITKTALKYTNPFQVEYEKAYDILQRIWSELNKGIIIASWKFSLIKSHPQSSNFSISDTERR